jgi:uncharacterized RmlC-like cupin family protein
MTSKYLIREDSVAGYSPANHHGTSNRRLIGADNVGAQNLEMILGTIARGGGALPHAHPGLEQVCYLLAGTAHVEVNDNLLANLGAHMSSRLASVLKRK